MSSVPQAAGRADIGRAARVAQFAGAAIARMHMAAGGAGDDSELLAAWVARLWSAACDGHVCITVDDDRVRARLASSPMVGDAPGADAASAGRPLVLDADRLYPERFWRAETRLARNLVSHARHDPLAPADEIHDAIEKSFGASRQAQGDPQRVAVERGLSRRLLLLSGGPGTGKTTTIARLVAIAHRLAPGLRVAVAAPTGKAASRAIQALAGELSRLGVDALHESMPRAGFTLHRLLGAHGPGRGFSHDPGNPVPYDMVVVDEASMIDLEMADALLAALRPDTRLVLAGDRDQLASVEAGAVFAAACEAPAGPVADSAVSLTRNYRQRDAAHIVALAASVRDGTAAAAAGATDGGRLERVDIDALRPEALVAEVVERVAGLMLPAWTALRASASIDGDASVDRLARTVLDAYARVGVLCALREGPAGSDRIGRGIAQRARRELGVPDSALWYPGRLVIVRRNAADPGLFNGEIGVCVSEAGRPVVVFDRGDDLLRVPALQMPPCADAYALTIHQSQGSEFETVLLVPAPAGHPLATREGLYTGITRARHALTLFTGPDALAWAAANPTRRDGDLARRLTERAPHG